MKTLFICMAIMATISSCQDAQRPVFEKVQNVKFGKLTVEETTLSADLQFTNSNNFGMRVKMIDCEVYVDSSYMGHFINTDAVRIKANSSFVLPMSGQVKSFVLMEQTRKAFTGKESILRVEGKARVGRSGFYKTIPINYTDTLLLKL